MSPVAYAVANEIHWYCSDVEHGGVESLLRQTQCTIYIIGGRNLIKSMKKACAQCRLLEKKQVEVAMGPKHENSLCIAPAFHNTQVDICGPFDSYWNSNKRAKVKIWFVVLVCCITGAVDCKTMEDYSTDSFVLAFIRFACRYGYPYHTLQWTDHPEAAAFNSTKLSNVNFVTHIMQQPVHHKLLKYLAKIVSERYNS